ncbi:hypothetical protein KCP73_02645 [Salmonella enterica subsp. enterica]|nr:hypothetical protein KCP73_02645 [Salmonella enterica subsp. enterica]
MNDPTCVLSFAVMRLVQLSDILSPSLRRKAHARLTVLLALGGDLSPCRLLMAYQHGIFRGFRPATIL